MDEILRKLDEQIDAVKKTPNRRRARIESCLQLFDELARRVQAERIILEIRTKANPFANGWLWVRDGGLVFRNRNGHEILPGDQVREEIGRDSGLACSLLICLLGGSAEIRVHRLP